MMFLLFKRDKPIGSYSSFASAKTIANRLRGNERAQRFMIQYGRKRWLAMLPPKGQGRAKWQKAS
jgi:hypothetical protein